ncbi:MAG: carbohydrate-binding protein, partial [Verrucomicrobia bacterium]|nr:carbohydrate-binding protein [Verrucomicrobiota bacterium]
MRIAAWFHFGLAIKSLLFISTIQSLIKISKKTFFMQSRLFILALVLGQLALAFKNHALEVVDAQTRGNSNRVTVSFSSPIDPATATNTSHYSIDHGVVVQRVAMAGISSVYLYTTPIPEGAVYALTLQEIQDQEQPPNTILPGSGVLFLQTDGVIMRKEFRNIGGDTSLADLTNHVSFPEYPDLVDWPSSFETPTNVRDNYGVQFQGYVTAPITGNYVFYLASDDQGAIYLSTDSNPANKRIIASEPGWNPERSWITGSNQESRPLRPPLEFFTNALFIEAEDFDYEGGRFVTDVSIGMHGLYQGGAYEGLGSNADADYDWHEEAMDNLSPTYRADTAVETYCRPGTLGWRDRGAFEVTVNHGVGWNDAGDWMNYTRLFPSPGRDYFVLARLSSGGNDISGQLDEVTDGVGTTTQSTMKLGTFRAPWTRGWEHFTSVPLRDDTEGIARVNMEGTRTLRFTTLPGDLDIDYLMFVPAGDAELDLSALQPSNISDPIPLEAGKKYYIEALMKEGEGGDNLAVAWQKPGDPELQNDDPPISGNYLSPLPLPTAQRNPPAPPEIVEVEMTLSAQLRWSTSSSPEVTRYVVSRSADGGRWENLIWVEGTSYHDKSVIADHDYRYRVSAMNAVGEVGLPSTPTESTRVDMQVRQMENYNYGGGNYPGYSNCPPANEPPFDSDLDPGFDYFYQYVSWVMPANPYRPDSMWVVDKDPDPDQNQYVITHTSMGDWWRYSFDVPTDGWVKLAIRAGTPNVATINIYWDEEQVAKAVCHTGSYEELVEFPATESFFSSAGQHTLRLEMADAAADLDLIGYQFAASPATRRIVYQEGFKAYPSAERLQADGEWSVVNGSGRNEVAWAIRSTDSEPYPSSFTAMQGRYATADSGNYPWARIDESLISPTIDCRDFTGTELHFTHNLQVNSNSDAAQLFTVLLDTINETTGNWNENWISIYQHTGADGGVTDSELIDVSQWADGRRFRLRWRFHEAAWDHWWAIDNVQVTA